MKSVVVDRVTDAKISKAAAQEGKSWARIVREALAEKFSGVEMGREYNQIQTVKRSPCNTPLVKRNVQTSKQ